MVLQMNGLLAGISPVVARHVRCVSSAADRTVLVRVCVSLLIRRDAYL